MSKLVLMQGNEACAKGAIRAGIRFFAGYPITPSSEVAAVMSEELPKVGGKFIQMEDEIASMAAIVGASRAGKMSLTATSGPGFSLMQEGLGYAIITETPCIIVSSQRGGPSTGMPTKPSQSDIMQARWGTHGDHPIIALYPHTVKETYTLVGTALKFAERYRTPVIFLMDEVLSHLRENFELPEEIEVVKRDIENMSKDENYLPYSETFDGIPPMQNFGSKFRYHITGLVHNELGVPDIPASSNKLLKRLYKKIYTHLDDICLTENYRTDDAEIVIVAYGITARSAYVAVDYARKHNIKAGLIRLITIWPFPTVKIQSILQRASKIVVPELNLGQVAREISRIVPNHKILQLNKIDGELITPEEIIEKFINHKTYVI